MHRSRAPSIAPGTFFVAQSWAGCITNMPGFNLRQAQWSRSIGIPGRNPRNPHELRNFVIDAARGQDELRLVLDTHVSLAFGVGAVLNAKSGKKIEIEQRAGGRQIWSEADKDVDQSWPKISIAREPVHADGTDIVSVGLTHDTSQAVRAYVQTLPSIGELLVASPDGGASNQSVKSGSHAFRLAESLTATIRSTETGQRRVHLFIAGPNAFAFLGQNQPAIGPVIVYEWDFDGLRDRNYSIGLELP